MTDDERSTEEFAWVSQAYAAFPAATPEAIDRAVADAVAVVSNPASTHTGAHTGAHTGTRTSAMAARGRWPRGRTTLALLVRWSPWIALALVLCIVIGLGEYRHRSDLARRQRAAALLEAPFASSSRGAPSSAREPSTPLDGTPFTPDPTHSPSVTTLPRTSDKERDTTSSGLMAPSQTPAIAPPLPTSKAQAVAGLDAASATVVINMLDSAQARGLPIEGVEARIHEGVRRNVPPQQIVVVARNYVAALANARTALGASSTVAELQVGAEALLAGTPLDALKQLRAARPVGSLVESLTALADLSNHGVSPLQASTALAALIARTGSDARVRALRAIVVDDIIRGVPPNAALADRVSHTGNNDLQSSGSGADSIPIHKRSP